MAVNEFMHPRNRYRERPNFQDLVKQFPELNQVAIVDVSGKVKLNYKDAQALQLLSKCLLQRDFGLSLELPPGKLVPTLPLRLNYIHWLEDIGDIAGWHEKEPVRGIDIGCGASCIYPLLAVVQTKQRWHMLAIEKAEDSLQIAKANVIRNSFEQFIDVRPQVAGGQTILLEVLNNHPDERFDFCMCNPPFYDSATGVKYQNRTGKRREPSNASTGSTEELCTDGGEVSFIGQIIEESLQLKDRVSVYTTMIGHKKSYEEILRKFKHSSIQNISVSKFCQGNTTRWAVGWSFDNRIVLNRLNDAIDIESHGTGKKKTLNKTIEWKIWNAPEGHQVSQLAHLKLYLIGVLQSIALHVRVLSEESEVILCELTAHQNTWSHQRRKRRCKETTDHKHEKHLRNSDIIESYDENENSQEKRPKLEPTAVCDELKQSEKPYLKAALNLHRKSCDYFVALQYIDGKAGKDSVNQILQYIKNISRTQPFVEMCL
ncbi:U6 small nuclear RNA (adenine-(43)-N(6))-methyltransferase [Anopheles ziemanni]|uniref:U6 small nuclear RNA (adenine-(43)-N(6))-methyltransferase n=1 Tax=Anopheles coustani TaxID=139045 RepID=UPI00265A3B79|nr:U6 small nuclear RNA (adenine-(43)-N(6))-methyltransferase [Anopheles coustani]XP_058172468.1 U6 small nuclear RNA (adenine-(43)-N(6))-methyltransferase [Anopheles ziemanni]